jgi:hypothetical protein
MPSNSLPNWKRDDGTPLVPQPAPTVNPTDFYPDPRYLNGRVKVQ